jgi:betaine-aldehyde dehydrogenase
MQESFQMYIDGIWTAGEGDSRQIIDPASETVIAEITKASEAQVQQSVEAAKRAFEETDWSTNVKLRVSGLRKLADLLELSSEDFAILETQNTGKPIRESRFDVSDSVTCLRYYADLVETGELWKSEMYDGTTSQVSEEAIGVCALVVPWNFPLLLGIWKFAPALAAGNTVVFKPSELTPLSFIKLAVLAKEAGIPPGVFNLILGGARTGQYLVTHPAVDKVSFTGGSETGRSIYGECAKTLKRVSLELGGKSPLLIFEDADIETAVGWAMFGAFFNQGQVCVASSRILVHHSLQQSFLQSLSERLSKIQIGDPLAESTEMGPVISEGHLQKIETYLRLGIKEGATLFTGGERVPGKSGYFITPAVFTEVNQNMRIVQEEIFGPVITVQSFKDQDEAVALANGTAYGLAAGVLSRDIEHAKRIANRLRAGTIWINGYHTPHIEAPWGGFKQSGIGRELGPYGLAAFTEPKHVNINKKLEPNSWYASSDQSK